MSGPRHNNQTRQRIISISQELFQESGFESVTINRICERVGISKHTFYYYFETKAELLVACCDAERKIGRGELTTILLSEDKYFEQFWKLQKPRIDFAVGCGSELLKNIQHIVNQHRVEESSRDSEQKEIEASVIRKAQQAGEIRNQAEANSLVLVSRVYYLGILTLWVSMNGAFDFEKAMRASIEICFDVSPELRRGEELHALIRPGG